MMEQNLTKFIDLACVKYYIVIRIQKMYKHSRNQINEPTIIIIIILTFVHMKIGFLILIAIHLVLAFREDYKEVLRKTQLFTEFLIFYCSSTQFVINLILFVLSKFSTTFSCQCYGYTTTGEDLNLRFVELIVIHVVYIQRIQRSLIIIIEIREIGITTNLKF